MGHDTCCVDNCKNTGVNSACKFYKFPQARWKQEQRMKWITAVKKKKMWSRTNGSVLWHDTHAQLLQLGTLLSRELPTLDVSLLQRMKLVTPSINVTSIMEKLSPSCEAMLRRCSWRGKIKRCDHLFATRITPLGFCCVFNSRYQKEDFLRKPKYLDQIGHRFGLNVVIKQNPDEFAFLRRARLGIDVLLFDGSEYPLLEGGGVRIYPLDQNLSAVLRLTATEQRGADCTRGGASYATCLTDCRRRTLAALCGCRLYTLLHEPDDNLNVCSLIDLPCLNKHKEKLSYYFPKGYQMEALEEERQNGLVCDDCSPDCARWMYSAAVGFTRPRPSYHHKIWRRMTRNLSMVNATVIRIFFTSGHQQVLSIETSKIWFESFATLSSLWVQLVGAAIVPALEVVFFLGVRGQQHVRRRVRLAARMEQHKASVTHS